MVVITVVVFDVIVVIVDIFLAVVVFIAVVVDNQSLIILHRL